MVLIFLETVCIKLFSLQQWVNSKADLALKLWYDNWSWRRETLNVNLYMYIIEIHIIEKQLVFLLRQIYQNLIISSRIFYNETNNYHHHQVGLITPTPLILFIRPNCSSLLVGPLDCTQCPHKAKVCKSALPVSQHCLSTCTGTPLILFIRPNCSSLLVGPLDCTQCPHKAKVCKSLPVSQHWFIHVYESTVKRRLSSSLLLQHSWACLARLIRMVCEKVDSVGCCFQDQWSYLHIKWHASKISWPVRIARQKYLIYWKVVSY